jgi:hypothetical protein
VPHASAPRASLSFVFWEEAPGGVCCYYEPHLDFVEASVRAALPPNRRVDVVIAPCACVSLGAYPLVLATPDAVLRLLRLLRPAALLPLRNDEVVESGAIAPAINTAGGVAAVRAALAADAALAGAVRVVEAAPPGQPLLLELPAAA